MTQNNENESLPWNQKTHPCPCGNGCKGLLTIEEQMVALGNPMLLWALFQLHSRAGLVQQEVSDDTE